MVKANQQYIRNSTPEVQKMIRAIRRTLTLEQLADVASHGADSGFPGFSYTLDCYRFYMRHHAAIWQLLNEAANDMGMTELALIASFRRADMAYDASHFGNLLAWFALETVAQNIISE